ncbi:hypothetical protein [Marinactinospora rubrisoli]|uniref:Uncharacterized protein n=1 Tax=Marinactinospora rubrisoli TaxID=2715399 RepID=A0ABW2KCH5_9ACTN
MDRLVLGQGWSIDDYERLRGRRASRSASAAAPSAGAGVPTPRGETAPPTRRGRLADGLVGQRTDGCADAAHWHVTGAPWR